MTDIESIVLGWQVTNGLDPKYWIGPRPEVGNHKHADCVCVDPKAVAHHTVVVAQSGSGKSYFLGRYLEEVAIKTKARLVIFDPNADFRKINDIVDADSWRNAKYDLEKRKGFLPDEADRDDFLKRWNNVTKCVRTLGKRPNSTYRRLQIAWPSIRIEFMADEVDPELKTELLHCHEVVRALGDLIALCKDRDWQADNDLLSAARKFFSATRERTEKEIVLQLREDYSDEFATTGRTNRGGDRFKFSLITLLSRNFTLNMRQLEEIRQKAATARVFVSEKAEQIYFSNASAVQGAGVLSSTRRTSTTSRKNPTSKGTETGGADKKEEATTSVDFRIEVIDLPSIRESNHRLLVVSSILETLWTKARADWEVALDKKSELDDRVPTLLVVDEAHNLMPAEPRNAAERRLREQFRTIAAEGRKFGLFLVVVSQRPDKLDSLIVSECENRAVMKLGSHEVLNSTIKLLGLTDAPNRMLEKCLEFDVGRTLIAGPWASNNPIFLYGAPRRTQEGGRNLRYEHWAVAEALRGEPNGGAEASGVRNQATSNESDQHANANTSSAGDGAASQEMTENAQDSDESAPNIARSN